MRSIAICFGQFGPYHHARVVALQRTAEERGLRVIPVQISSDTATYKWSSGERKCRELQTLCSKVEEEVSPIEVFLQARRLFKREEVDVAFVPSYSPARYLAFTLAAMSLGIRTVMMNDSHADTEQATGWRKWIKRQIVKRFDAALVAGSPQKRHFASLGIPDDKIFTGYDAVDNALFAAKAAAVRKKSDEWREPESAEIALRQTCDELGKQSESLNVREVYGLPERYFLSLGRMVEKKNLATLVAAYAKFCDEWRVTSDESARQAPVALVFVGSGELEGALREQARNLGLRVIERTNWKTEQNSHRLTRISTDGSERLASDRTEGNAAGSVTRAGCGLSPETIGGEGAAAMETPDSLLATRDEENRGTVFFYGFRQIEENPVFYALAEAFVLPSLKEEWGLVVNEAMAAGLPVIVSRTAGCAEDLVPGSGQVARTGVCGDGSPKRATGWLVAGKNAGDSLEQRSNGFVFDPKSCDALSEALRRIADQETDGLTEMGRRSREIVTKFSCENFARQALRAAEATCVRATIKK